MAARSRAGSLLAAPLARVLFASRVLDRVYRALERGRSELVAAYASDEVLDRFNDLAYASDRSYVPDAGSFRAYLFPFEEEAIGRLFPPPPAHVLVGAAGGGREALALVERGYRVTAFEPSERLAKALAARSRGEPRLAVYRARYEELPHLGGTSGGLDSELAALDEIDAAIAGWGSFSHLRTREQRLATLRSLGGATSGPILVSFLGLYDEGRAPASAAGRLRRALPRRRGRGPADVFSASIGFYHLTNEQEVEALAAAAGLEIVHRSFDTRDTNWPHVVLRRSAA